MKRKNYRHSIATIAGSTVIATLAAVPAVAEAEGLFRAEDIGNGYLLAGKGDAEGKCGEGKCGATDEAKDDAEGKCGEGKCGASDEGKDGAEGKCGEGKCGNAA